MATRSISVEDDDYGVNLIDRGKCDMLEPICSYRKSMRLNDRPLYMLKVSEL